MIELNTFKKLLGESDGRLPLLTLDEFFNGNTSEDAIAPNQYGFGRPAIAEIWEALQKIGQMENVAWVRVALHDDTEIATCDGMEVLNLYGDTIIICTAAGPDEMEELVNCRWLCSDGAVETEVCELNEIYSRIPPVPDGFNCLEIVWD